MSFSIDRQLCNTTDVISSVQFNHSVGSDSLRPNGLQHARLPVHHQLLEPTHTHVQRVGDAIQPSQLLSSPSPPAINLSEHQGLFLSRFFALGGQSIGVSASTSVLPMNPGVFSFRMDWLDLLAVRGTLKSVLQHHSSKESILQRSAFFIVQLSHPYMTIGETIALSRQIFVGKVMSLLLKKLSRLVIVFLPRSKYLLISWMQSSPV